jgi:hypothetical protein
MVKRRQNASKQTIHLRSTSQFESDKFHSATAQTIEEARHLIEAGFEHACTYENVMLFRKRK